ncbi:MAG: amidohydrolase family protein [Methanobrevibacter sp.]|jgi:imidazolonepropionase-like amidohydrolase|nr:amidohydrolase family protein [Candidatus Methanoflexus mossambicus]
MDDILIKNINIIKINQDSNDFSKINTEKEKIENSSIAIKNGRITSISKDISHNKSNYDKIIDGNDGYLLPGFIDAHVHLLANGFNNEDYMSDPLSYYFYKAIPAMKKTLFAGITTARDCGLADFGVKTAILKKLFLSPKLQISVMPLSITGGHFDITLKSGHDMIPRYNGFPHPVCNGVEGVIAKTREVVRSGADFVKIMASGGVISESDSPQDIQFNKKEIKAIVDEARRLGGKYVAAHCHGLGGLELSLKAGVRTIEHGTSITKKLAHEMVDKNAFLVPTFSVIKWQRKQAKKKLFREDKNEKALEVSKIHQENIEMAYNEEVTIAMGTDSGVMGHGENLKELSYLSKMMSPYEAIVAGTLTSAKCLKIDNKVGSIEKGKIADLIITDKNPLDNISYLEKENNIKMVFQDGSIVKNINI